MLVLCVVFCSLFCLSTCAQTTTECKGKPDIVFVLDSSSSEGPTNFNKQLDFVKAFVNAFTVGPNATQFSIVTFATTVQHQFWLKDYTSKRSLTSAISKVQYASGSTYTNLALNFVRNNSFTHQHGGRSDAEHIVIVLTDGQSTQPTDTKTAADLLHKTGVEVMSVGIGTSVTQTELENIASDRQHVFQVQNFDALTTIQSELEKSACQVATVQCQKKLADIMFVLDASSSIGDSDFTKQLDFVKNFIRKFDIGPNSTQFGVLSFSSQTYDEFHLNTYKTKTQILGAVSNISYHHGNTYTDLALQQVANQSFSQAFGGRKDASQIVIVMTDGQSSRPSNTVTEAKKLHQLGLEVIAVGIANAVDTELNAIATDASHVFKVTNFDALTTIQSELEKAACQVNECHAKKADIVFLLDSSSSEGPTNFQKQISFVKNFTKEFIIGPDKVQMGLVTFSTSPQNQFWLKSYSNKADLMTALNSVKYTSGNTYTDLALNFVKNNSFTTKHGARGADVSKILIVMTDGQSTRPTDTVKAANSVHNQGIKTISIGIGSGVDQSELQTIATDSSQVFKVANFNALSTIQKSLAETTCKTEKPDKVCGNAPADIVFILDSSGSEGSSNFRKQLDFVGDFVKQFQIGPNSIQIGLVTFSNVARNEFYFNTYHDQQSVLNKLKTISYIGSNTHTELGLQYARLFHFQNANHGARPNAKKIAIVMTDGQSQSRTLTAQQAQYLHKLGVKTISIGIGSSIVRAELESIASDHQHVFTVSGFDVLKSIVYELKSTACESTKPPPTVCGYSEKADIIFVLDSSSSEGPTNFQKQLDFVSKFAQDFAVGPNNVQFSILTFSTLPHNQFYLNAYRDKSSLLSAIQRITYTSGNTHTELALHYVRKNNLKSWHGARSDSPHYVIVLTDGVSSNRTGTQTEAALLKQKNVTVIAIGIGSSVDRKEINGIATDSRHVFNASTFDALSTIKNEVKQATCGGGNAGSIKSTIAPSSTKILPQTRTTKRFTTTKPQVTTAGFEIVTYPLETEKP